MQARTDQDPEGARRRRPPTRPSAEAEAAQIRQAKGDIDAERARLLAEAEAQAAAVLADGRARLDDEVAELEAEPVADIAAAGSRVSDELRAEIARCRSPRSTSVVTGRSTTPPSRS